MTDSSWQNFPSSQFYPKRKYPLDMCLNASCYYYYYYFGRRRKDTNCVGRDTETAHRVNIGEWKTRTSPTHKRIICRMKRNNLHINVNFSVSGHRQKSTSLSVGTRTASSTVSVHDAKMLNTVCLCLVSSLFSRMTFAVQATNKYNATSEYSVLGCRVFFFFFFCPFLVGLLPLVYEHT